MPNYGWFPQEDRTDETKRLCAAHIAAMPDFSPIGDDYGMSKACIWEVIRKGNLGEYMLDQQTGSCVGHGMENALIDLQALEIVRNGELETYKLPFLPWHYGLGRLESGIRGRGEGSTGSGQAEAVAKYGIIPQDAQANLPPVQTKSDGSITWGSSVEMQWSDGDWVLKHIELLGIAKTNLVRRTSLMKSAKDVKAWIGQGLGPVTIASDWGGLMWPPVVDGVLLNYRANQWMHQMCIRGWWDHEKLGTIYWIQNSWGDAHGSCPSGAPKGGFWVKEKEVEYIVRQDDSFGITDLDGFDEGSNIWNPL